MTASGYSPCRDFAVLQSNDCLRVIPWHILAVLQSNDYHRVVPWQILADFNLSIAFDMIKSVSKVRPRVQRRTSAIGGQGD